ncbi:MAG: Rieske 2Fe-2S domain-containing protein [Bauldia sp.]|nr:Rieske 2Fe-2S domain-containing protein [Bauldia sp.]
MNTEDALRPDAIAARGPDLSEELAHLVRPDVVHRRLYTDPALFDIEMDRIFGGTWAYLGHESEVEKPGSFVRKRLGRRQVLLVRTEAGEVRGLLNRCTHRGTMLMAEDRGCQKRFTCPYHGWSFDLDGRIRNLPVADSYDRLFERPFDLGQLRVESFRGFVFATMAAEPLPLLAWLGPARRWLDEHIDRHPGGRLRVLPTAVIQEYRANWKMSWDNAADGIHATFAHRSYNLLGKEAETETVLARNPATTPMISMTLGHGHCVVDQRPGIPAGPWSTMRPLPTRADLEDALAARGEATAANLDLATGNMVNLSLFPNLLFVGNQLMVVEPLGVDHTRVSMFLVVADGAPEEINLLRLRVDEDFVSFGTPDDLEMFERVQEGLKVVEEEWVDISRGDHAGDVVGEDGLVTGGISSEAPIRAYLEEWKRLMSKPIPTTVRRSRIEAAKFAGARPARAAGGVA